VFFPLNTGFLSTVHDAYGTFGGAMLRYVAFVGGESVCGYLGAASNAPPAEIL